MAAGEDVGKNVGEEDPGGDLGMQPAEWFDEPESSSHDLRANPHPTPGWEEEERSKPLGLVITAALLFVLFAAAVLFNGHGSFGPEGRPSFSGPNRKALGDFLYSTEAAVSCPLSSVDSATGSVVGPPLERCPSRDGGDASHPHY
jgi:hypothetical protein